MSKKLKLLSIFTFLILIIGFIGYNYVMRGGARNLADEATAYTTTSVAILEEFTKNSDVSNSKYLEKAMAISGKITAVSPTNITLDNSIICALNPENKTVQKDQKVTVKGRFIGYDDLMEELKFDKCFIIKN